MAFISLRQLLDHAAYPSEFDLRKSLIAAKKAVRALCKARFEAFGCSGHVDHIEPIALDAMVNRYH